VNLDTGNWVGFIAPKGVPEEIIAKLDRAIEKALKSPEVLKSWREMGNVTTYLNHKDFAKWLATHVPETRALVESMGCSSFPRRSDQSGQRDGGSVLLVLSPKGVCRLLITVGCQALRKTGDPSMIFDMPSCGGCRTCEMACSFRHRKSLSHPSRVSGP